MKHRIFGLLLLGCMAATGGPRAWADVSVSIKNSDRGDYLLEGQFITDASRETAWGVLTDYDHIPVFVRSMRLSKVKARDDGDLLVEQVSVARALLFRRSIRVLLKVREEPYHRVSFKDISASSFRLYEGSWSLEEAGGKVCVVYRLEAQGGFMAPRFIARGASRKIVQGMLQEVRAEMDRREIQKNLTSIP